MEEARAMTEGYRGELLKQSDLFSPLTDVELKKVQGMMAVKQFRKNEVILFDEDTNRFMYVILFGEVKVSQTSEEGKEIILAIHQSGDFFGEMSLIDGKTLPARVSSTEDSTIALISREDFYSLIFGERKLAEKLMQILCSRLRESWSKIQILNFNNASQRVKMLLIMLSEKHGVKEDDGIRLRIKLTHQDIAEMTGMSRETVTRVLDKWRKEGEISIREKMIFLGPEFSEMGGEKFRAPSER